MLQIIATAIFLHCLKKPPRKHFRSIIIKKEQTPHVCSSKKISLLLPKFPKPSVIPRCMPSAKPLKINLIYHPSITENRFYPKAKNNTDFSSVENFQYTLQIYFKGVFIISFAISSILFSRLVQRLSFFSSRSQSRLSPLLPKEYQL